MKKYFILFATMIMLAPASFAESIIKTYTAYTVKNHKVSELVYYFDNATSTEAYIKKIKVTPNAYYAEWQKTEHYYLKFYPANENTNIYIVSDVSYDKDNNTITDFFKQHNMKYSQLKDNDALKEYQFDFVDVARSGALNGLFIMPDYIKPLKTGMGKLNDKISKNSKKDSSIPYSPDNDPIDLTCVDTQTFTNDDAQVSVTIKEYRMKNKQNKYVHAFEYVVRNNDSSPIMIEKVTSERLAGMKDITTQTFVDLDRLDLLDTVGSFPPVAICTCGTSLVFTGANAIRLGMVTKESLRFAKTLPEKQQIKANGKLRILVMKFKNDPKPLNFTATRNGQTYYFSY